MTARAGRRTAALALAAAVVLGGAAGCAGPARERVGSPRERDATPAARGEVGLASYYGGKFHGRRTASGVRYDQLAMTCAHPSAPFGTRLRVTELEGGRSVVVTVNDRGPFVRGRIVDVSLAAARTLGIVERGVAKVRVERVD